MFWSGEGGERLCGVVRHRRHFPS